MAPWRADIHLLHDPPLLDETVLDGVGKSLGATSIVIAHKGGVVTEHDLLCPEILVVSTEIIDQLRQPSLILDEERLDDSELHVLAGLSDDHPVDVGVGIEGDPQRCRRVQVPVEAAIDVPQFLHVETDGIDIGVVGRLVEVGIRLGIVEAVLGMLDAPTHDGGTEGGGRHVALALSDKILTENLEVLYRREFLVEQRVGAQLVDDL